METPLESACNAAGAILSGLVSRVPCRTGKSLNKIRTAQNEENRLSVEGRFLWRFGWYYSPMAAFMILTAASIWQIISSLSAS